MRTWHIVISIAMISTGVWAADPKAAKQHLRNAETLRKQGNLSAAIGEFELAYTADPRPEILLLVAEKCEQDGDIRHSRDYHLRYLSEYQAKKQRPAPDREQVEAKIRALTARIEEAEAAARPPTPPPSPKVEPTPIPPPTTPPPPEPRRPDPSPGSSGDTGARRKVGIGLLTGGLILSIGGAVLLGSGAYDSTSAAGPEPDWNAAQARGPAEITGGAVTACIGVASVVVGIVLLTKSRVPAGTAIMPTPGGGQFVVRF